MEVEVNEDIIQWLYRSLFQIHQKLKKVVLRLQPANFVTKPSVVAVLPEQLPTFCLMMILGRPVLGQTKAGIQSCIAINKKDDEWREILKNAQWALSKVMREKEEAAASKKAKASGYGRDSYIQPHKITSAESSMKDSQKSLQRCHQRHGTRCAWSPGTLNKLCWEYVFSLKSFPRQRVSETCQLTDTSSRRSATRSAIS